jgi:hypothetical protein
VEKVIIKNVQKYMKGQMKEKERKKKRKKKSTGPPLMSVWEHQFRKKKSY